MSKTRVYQVAENLNISTESLIEKLAELDINVAKDDVLEGENLEIAMELSDLEEDNGNKIVVEGEITVKDLTERLDKPASEIIMKLMKMGTMATINQE